MTKNALRIFTEGVDTFMDCETAEGRSDTPRGRARSGRGLSDRPKLVFETHIPIVDDYRNHTRRLQRLQDTQRQRPVVDGLPVRPHPLQSRIPLVVVSQPFQEPSQAPSQALL